MSKKTTKKSMSIKNIRFSQLISAAFTLFTLYKSLRSLLNDLKKK